MPEFFKKKELDKRIRNPDCGHPADAAEMPVFFVPDCHVQPAVCVSYFAGEVRLDCPTCRKLVATFQIK